MRGVIETVGWVALGVVGGSLLACAVVYVHEERQFQRVNRKRR